MIDVNDSYGAAAKQRRLLNITVAFHEFCVSRNIKYTIIGGTLLGAIREKGFIPWDDDMDVLMSREEFEKLRPVADGMEAHYLKEHLWVYRIVEKEEFENNGLDETTPMLDIFIADRVPKGKLRKKFKVLMLKMLQGMMKTRTNKEKKVSFPYRVALKVTALIGKLFSTKRKQKMYESVSKWGNKNSEQPLMICNDIFQSVGCEYDPHLLDECTEVGFEDVSLMAVKNWDNYLKEQYGDYMTPVRTAH